MTNKEDAASTLADDERFAQIPADFPRPVHFGAVPGAQPKVLLTEYKGRFYSPGSSPPELYERWDICEDLARQLAAKSLDSKAGKRAHMSEVEVLDQYLPRLIAQKWTSEGEARWIIRRASEMLNWPVPAAAQEPGDGPQGGQPAS